MIKDYITVFTTAFLNAFFKPFFLIMFTGVALFFYTEAIIDAINANSIIELLISRPTNYITGHTSGHTLVYAIMFTFATYIYIRIYLAFEKHDWKHILIISAWTTIFGGMMYAINEGIWNLLFLIKTNGGLIPYMPNNLYNYTLIPIAISLGIITKAFTLLDRRRFKYAMIVLLSYFAFWYIIGFPITIDVLANHSAYYYDPFVNVLELTHWALALSLFAYAFRIPQSPQTHEAKPFVKQLTPVSQ